MHKKGVRNLKKEFVFVLIGASIVEVVLDGVVRLTFCTDFQYKCLQVLDNCLLELKSIC